MNRYRLLVAYDGTYYNGWQTQPGLPTVADSLQKAFVKCFNRKVSLVGVSRTDAGVHALNQVVSIRTDLELPPNKLLFAWNNRLPDDIVIRSLKRTTFDDYIFNNIISKTYYYHFFDYRPLPFMKRYGWHVRRKIDFKKLEDSLQTFVGTHNFRSFSTGHERGDDTIRTIDSIGLTYIKRFGVYRITVRGKKFLQHMIRRIVGASMEVACRPELSTNRLVRAINECNPNQCLPNAPAKGLMLYKIYYGNTVR